MIAALCTCAGVSAAFLVVVCLILPIGLLTRLLGAVVVATSFAPLLINGPRHWIPVGVAAGFFALLLVSLWELLVVTGDAQRGASRATRPPTNSRW